MHRVPRIWLMIADQHVMRIFSKKKDGICMIAEILPHRREDLKMNNRTIGRVAGSSRSAVRHKYEPHMNESHKTEINFTHEIAEWLNIEAEENSFDRLILVAPPHMLGELRKTIDRHVHARIVAEIHKDLTKMPESELRDEVEKILWF